MSWTSLANRPPSAQLFSLLYSIGSVRGGASPGQLHGAMTDQLVSWCHRVVLSQGSWPPSLAMKTM